MQQVNFDRGKTFKRCGGKGREDKFVREKKERGVSKRKLQIKPKMITALESLVSWLLAHLKGDKSVLDYTCCRGYHLSPSPINV